MKMLLKQEYYNSLPKKPMGAGVLFFNEKEELLIVRPSYKDYWLVPGGTVEENESPSISASREVKEELDIDIKIGQLLCLEYGQTLEGDNLKFIFSGGVLNEQQIVNIKLQEEELLEYKFVPISVAMELLGKAMSARIPYCLEAIEMNTIIYLENGERI